MLKEEAKKIIEQTLIRMGCENIEFVESGNDLITVLFDSKEITSFVETIPGWTYSGIQLDLSGKHQYKIDFKKI